MSTTFSLLSHHATGYCIAVLTASALADHLGAKQV